MTAPPETPAPTLRPVGPADVAWLVRAGLSPELVGVQYHWAEAPLQLIAAPVRGLLGPFVACRIVEVGGRRAGYVGRSPLSGNYEYFLLPWARGDGRGRSVIEQFLREGRSGDRARNFVVRNSNERSLRALLGAIGAIGWSEGADYGVKKGRFHTSVRVRADPGG